MDIQGEHKVGLKPTVIVLGVFLGICLIIMVFGGNKLYRSMQDNALIKKDNERIEKNIKELEKMEFQIRKDASIKIDSLENQVVLLKRGFKKGEDEINNETDLLVGSIDTIEFYPLYLQLAAAGGAKGELWHGSRD